MLSDLRSLSRPSLPAAEVRSGRIGGILAVGGLLVAGALLSPVHPAVVDGESMTPTLHPGQVVLCSRDGGDGELRRGDVVLLRRGREVYVKRIFALGGERFWQTSGLGGAPASMRGCYPSLLTVGQQIGPGRQRFPRLRFQQVAVPRDSVYVVGDGNNSVDSRAWGAVPKEQLLGRVVFPALQRKAVDLEPAVFSSLPRRPAARS